MRQTSKSAVLLSAAVLGVVAASLAYVFLAAQVRSAPERVPVVVAKHAIPPGTVVDASMVDLRSFPTDSAPKGAASAREMVIGKVSGIPIKAGEPISMSYVEARNRLSQMIPPFMRAITVAVDPISGVGGFLKPGDHVDVIATFNVNQGTITKTVLQDVTLVAMGPQVVGDDQRPQVTGKATQPASVANATLVVLPSDAEKLVLADSKGKLRLALRRTDDMSRIRPRGVTSRAMLGVVPPDVPKEKPQSAAQVSPPAPYAPPYILPPAAPPAAKPQAAVSSASLFTKLKPLPLPSAKKTKAPRTIEIIRGTKVEHAVVSD